MVETCGLFSKIASMPYYTSLPNIVEKMTLLETRLSQTERRVERDMNHIHAKMDEMFRTNLPDKP